MNRILVIIALLIAAASSYGMVGGPILCVGPQMTAMTVEVSQVNVKITSPDATEKQNALSNRMALTARYGLAPALDVSGSMGAANLNFSKMQGGYSDFDANWTFSWGAGLRAGYPVEPNPVQVIAALNYFGYQPKGSAAGGLSTVSSKYLWHELSPSAALAVRAGKFVPYVGLTKPYLFGRKEATVSMVNRPVSRTTGTVDYSDGSQPLRGILGVDWRLPEGYSIGAEAAATTGGIWTLSIGIAQVLK